MNKSEAIQVMHRVIGNAMTVYNEYHRGLLESAYEAALCHVLNQDGLTTQRQVFLPLYWKDVKLDQSYRLDLVVADEIIIELKAVRNVDNDHRHQLFNYMNITHMPFGMILNFGGTSLYSECYQRDPQTGEISRIFPRLPATTTDRLPARNKSKIFQQIFSNFSGAARSNDATEDCLPARN